MQGDEYIHDAALSGAGAHALNRRNLLGARYPGAAGFRVILNGVLYFQSSFPTIRLQILPAYYSLANGSAGVDGEMFPRKAGVDSTYDLQRSLRFESLSAWKMSCRTGRRPAWPSPSRIHGLDAPSVTAPLEQHLALHCFSFFFFCEEPLFFFQVATPWLFPFGGDTADADAPFVAWRLNVVAQALEAAFAA
jgi:hypothetical protein